MEISLAPRQRAAAHLLDAELRNNLEAAQRILDGHAYVTLPTDAWQQTRLELADVMPYDLWTQVADIYKRVHAFNWRVAAGVLQESSERHRVCESILESAAEATDAVDLLAEWA